MAFSSGNNRLSSCEINVTPLIDILLVLLIIFMVIVPVTSRGLAVEAPLPAEHPTASAAPQGPVLIEIASRPVPSAPDTGGAATPVYRVGGQEVRAEEIGARLGLLLASRAERQVLLQADPRLSYGVVADVIDQGRSAGAGEVELLTPGSKWAH